MFTFICKSFPHLKHSFRTSPTHKFHILQLSQLLSTSSKQASKPISETANQDSFAVNYFIKTCGFAPEKALSATKYVNFDKADKPDAVISLLKNKGFTNTQITKLIKTHPCVVLCDPKKTLLTKIEFFESKGFTKTQLPIILLVAPYILTRSLKKNIMPTFEFLKDFLGCDENVMIAIKRCPLILVVLQSRVVPRIEILRNAGVSDAKIADYLKDRPVVFTKRSDRFKESVDEIKKMGFDLISWTFIVGVSVLALQSRLSWKEKMEVFSRWGCSEDEVLVAFKRYPWCMMVSRDKIERIMDVFVNEMGCESSKVLKSSYLLTYSLNKRIIPRCSVYQVLISKGLIKEQVNMTTIIGISEKSFLEKFVHCYEKEAPELFKLYQERLENSSALNLFHLVWVRELFRECLVNKLLKQKVWSGRL